MIEMPQREPHDEKTPEEVIERILRDHIGQHDPAPLAALVIEALAYKAYFEQAEGALRWLDPTDVLARISV